jgi:hypothetical protein
MQLIMGLLVCALLGTQAGCGETGRRVGRRVQEAGGLLIQVKNPAAQALGWTLIGGGKVVEFIYEINGETVTEKHELSEEEQKQLKEGREITIEYVGGGTKRIKELNK